MEQTTLADVIDPKAAIRSQKSSKVFKAMAGDREIDVPSLDIDKISEKGATTQIAQDIRDARRAATQRQLEAPEILAGQNPQSVNVMDSIVKDMRRKGRIPDGAHAFWGAEVLHRNYPSQGYFPVTESESSTQVRFNEMELWFCSQAQYVAQELVADRESRSRMNVMLSNAETSVKQVEGVMPVVNRSVEPQPATNSKSPLE